MLLSPLLSLLPKTFRQCFQWTKPKAVILSLLVCWMLRGAQMLSWAFFWQYLIYGEEKIYHPEMRGSSLCNHDYGAAWMDSLGRNVRDPLRIVSILSRFLTFPGCCLPSKYLFLIAQGRYHPSALCCFPFCNLYVRFCIPSEMKGNKSRVNNDGKICNINAFLKFYFIFL